MVKNNLELSNWCCCKKKATLTLASAQGEYYSLLLQSNKVSSGRLLPTELLETRDNLDNSKNEKQNLGHVIWRKMNESGFFGGLAWTFCLEAAINVAI